MLGFLFAVAAGFVTPHLDEPVSAKIAGALKDTINIEPSEYRVVSFMVAMLAAAILAALVDNDSPLAIIVGGVIGYFLMPLVEILKKTIEGKPRS